MAVNTSVNTGPDIQGAVGATSSFNLIGDGSGFTGISNGTSGNQIGTNAAPLDPKLGPLADNGGPTKTHALLAHSPAFDKGNPAFNGTGKFDQRGIGYPRLIASAVDIGAFEFLLPSLSINDVTVNEGDSGPTTATFTVTLSPASTQTVTVDFSTANGTTNPATANLDYIEIVPTTSPTTLTFAPGETTKSIGVSIVGDTTFEPDETFFVNLSAPTNAIISDAAGPRLHYQ